MNFQWRRNQGRTPNWNAGLSPRARWFFLMRLQFFNWRSRDWAASRLEWGSYQARITGRVSFV